ncbi:uncharacterized protein VTP21DRAFT_374 [Calcarisporiella thermophila]|uniref:uncharacterized protein n=1 Tax=Calcarisporiella thermophila TaxID=911321 RepID=UPI003743C0D7
METKPSAEGKSGNIKNGGWANRGRCRVVTPASWARPALLSGQSPVVMASANIISEKASEILLDTPFVDTPLTAATVGIENGAHKYVEFVHKPLKPKKIVVLCDGTWYGPAANSNVRKLYEEMKIDTDQVVYYDSGVGIGGTIQNFFLSGAVAKDIDEKIKEAYRFIVKYYHPEARVWLFGFSRGAYTARCVSGIINHCGILEAANIALVDRVYEIYRSRDPVYAREGAEATSIRTQSSHPIDLAEPPIEFLGLWDTVGALGLPSFFVGRGFEYLQFHDQYIPNIVRRVKIHNESKKHGSPGCTGKLGGGQLMGIGGDPKMPLATLLWMIEKIFEENKKFQDETRRLRLKEEDIEVYREKYAPWNGPSENLPSRVIRVVYGWVSNCIQKTYLYRDRIIPLKFINDEGKKQLHPQLLFNMGDWQKVYGPRDALGRRYPSSIAYEELRDTMDSIGVTLPNGILY